MSTTVVWNVFDYPNSPTVVATQECHLERTCLCARMTIFVCQKSLPLATLLLLPSEDVFCLWFEWPMRLNARLSAGLNVSSVHVWRARRRMWISGEDCILSLIRRTMKQLVQTDQTANAGWLKSAILRGLVHQPIGDGKIEWYRLLLKARYKIKPEVSRDLHARSVKRWHVELCLLNWKNWLHHESVHPCIILSNTLWLMNQHIQALMSRTQRMWLDSLLTEAIPLPRLMTSRRAAWLLTKQASVGKNCPWSEFVTWKLDKVHVRTEEEAKSDLL